ncbi:MAG: thioredoxin-disulfide reductase [Chitinivibrionales bacterium]|nr:thioredoxin-disulfide reductase [Chitinivibrionales bacterium]MBD3394533.1 thioredoxin-disulfide reductase [Chitinivibrionales bacterium]
MPQNVIIIGSGPAGLTAAIYTARANLAPVVFEGFQMGGMPGGQLMTTGLVENYPGFKDGIDGQQLMAEMKEQAARFGAEMIMEDVVEVDLGRRPFVVRSMSGRTKEAEALIIATGAVARRLPLDTEKSLWGKGISACAVCDGALPIFRNKPLAVVGGGDSAVEEAVHLTQFGSRVYMIHRRDELRASKIMQKRAMEHPKIEILWNKVVEEFLGDAVLQKLKLKDTQSGEISELEVSGAFEAIGHVPNTAFLKGQLATTENGYLITQADSTVTSVEGVFAAGDVQDAKFRQAVTAAGTGCMAAIEAERWLAEQS